MISGGDLLELVGFVRLLKGFIGMERGLIKG